MTALAAWASALDVQALYWINHGWSRPALDAIFKLVTEQKNYIVPAAALAAFLWFKRGRQGRLCLLTLLLCVALTDPISSRVIKPWVNRARPCVVLPEVRTPHGDRGTFSFPSSHAVNIAGAGVVVGLTFPAWALPAALLAALVGLSRVYLGLHYPSDVLAGYLLGGLIGWACWTIVGLLQSKWRQRAAVAAS